MNVCEEENQGESCGAPLEKEESLPHHNNNHGNAIVRLFQNKSPDKGEPPEEFVLPTTTSLSDTSVEEGTSTNTAQIDDNNNHHSTRSSARRGSSSSTKEGEEDEWEPMPPPTCLCEQDTQEEEEQPQPPQTQDDNATEDPHTCPTTTISNISNNHKPSTRHVHFGTVHIRAYSRTIGDNPFCSKGAPIALDWDYVQLEPLAVDWHALHAHGRRSSARRLLLDPLQRRMLLWRWGFDISDIDAAVKRNEQEKRRQSYNHVLLPFFVLQEFIVTTVRRPPSSRQAELRYHTEKVRQLHQRQLSAADAEHGGLAPWQQQQQQQQQSTQQLRRRLSLRKSSLAPDSEISDGDSQHNHHNNNASDHDSVCSTAVAPVYHIRTDPRQHDKATEIILCSVARPHMRAFHGSWFGFFIGFIM